MTTTAPAPSKRGPIVYSDGELLVALRDLAQGELTLSRPDYERRRRPADPSTPLFERRFGSWNKALLRAGLEVVEQPLQLQGASTRWQIDQLIDAIRRCRQQIGSTALADYEVWRKHQETAPPASTIRYRLGSWSRATELACTSADCATTPSSA